MQTFHAVTVSLFHSKICKTMQFEITLFDKADQLTFVIFKEKHEVTLAHNLNAALIWNNCPYDP